MHKNKWIIRENDQKQIERLVDQLEISPILANLLLNRGYREPSEIRDFLSPQLENLSSPFELLNMGAVVERILSFVHEQKGIVVYGDYDVDGICASVILYQGLSALGAKVDYYVPDRLEEGYGINVAALKNIRQKGADLVVTVDCGISSYQEVEEAKTFGLEVIVTDHHQLPPTLPQTLIVDPVMSENLEGAAAWRNLCGAGVAFKLVQGLFEHNFGRENIMERMRPYLDLVALATVADIVALKGDNRILVKFGLEQIKTGERAGMAALCEVSRNDKATLNATALGFNLAPRLNACGRVGDVRLGLRLLTTTDEKEAIDIARSLDEENKKRQAIERQIFEEALAIVEGSHDEIQAGLVVVGEDWHPGVIGIVASRLVERFYTPTIVLTRTNGIYKGSGRSIEGFHLQQALSECEEYLESYGGHAQAAGLSLKLENLAAFRVKFAQTVAERTTNDSFIPQIAIDGEINLNELNYEIFEEINKIQPTGMSNPSPVFICRGQTTTEVRTVGTNGEHLRIKLKTNQGEIVGIGFKKAELENLLSEGSVDIAFSLDKNTFNGKTSLQLLIKDIKSFRRPDDMSFVDRLFHYYKEYLKIAPYQNIAEMDSFYTKIVGVTFDQRQSYISKLQEGDRLQLVRQKDNPHDENAVMVQKNEQTLGFLRKELAKNIAPLLGNGHLYEGVVEQVTGGGTKNYGVNILIKKVADHNVAKATQARREILSSLSDNDLHKVIKESLIGENDYRPKQREAIQMLIEGKSLLAVLGTGRGKSAIFQTYSAYLALKRQLATIIVYPLRALVNDQFLSLKKKLAPLGLNIVKGTGALESDERAEFFAQLREGKVDIVLTTPEFLVYNQQRFSTISERIGLIVVDEAHHLASRRQGYRQLPQTLRQIGQLQILAVTATANEAAAKAITEGLVLDEFLLDSHVRENLRLEDQRQNTDKMAYLQKLATRGEKTVVYVNSRKQAVKIAQSLREKMPSVIAQQICYYHGGLSNSDRLAIETAFKEGSLRLIVTTSAFGEGIDIPDIKNVVLYHLSFSAEEYNQLAGRAGRNGEEAIIHLLYNQRDEGLNRVLLEGSCPKRENLVQFYKLLMKLSANKQALEMTNLQLAEYADKEKIVGFSENTASHWLGIFEELGLLERERVGNKRRIAMIHHPQKVDLERSLRFREGIAELDDFERYLQIAFHCDHDQLLEAVNRPIFPASWL